MVERAGTSDSQRLDYVETRVGHLENTVQKVLTSQQHTEKTLDSIAENLDSVRYKPVNWQLAVAIGALILALGAAVLTPIIREQDRLTTAQEDMRNDRFTNEHAVRHMENQDEINKALLERINTVDQRQWDLVMMELQKK